MYLIQCHSWMDPFLSIQEDKDLYQELEGTQQCLKEVILMKVKVIHMTIDHLKDEGILEEGDIIKIEVEGHPIEKVINI